MKGPRSDRVPDELWNEVHDIVQETGIKTIPIENTLFPEEKTLHMDIARWSTPKSD